MELKIKIGYEELILLTFGKWYATLNINFCGVQNYWRIGKPPIE